MKLIGTGTFIIMTQGVVLVLIDPVEGLQKYWNVRQCLELPFVVGNLT